MRESTRALKVLFKNGRYDRNSPFVFFSGRYYRSMRGKTRVFSKTEKIYIVENNIADLYYKNEIKQPIFSCNSKTTTEYCKNK